MEETGGVAALLVLVLAVALVLGGAPEIIIGSRRPRAELIWLRRDAQGKPYRNLRSEAPRGPDVDGFHLWLPEVGTTDEHR